MRKLPKDEVKGITHLILDLSPGSTLSIKPDERVIDPRNAKVSFNDVQDLLVLITHEPGQLTPEEVHAIETRLAEKLGQIKRGAKKGANGVQKRRTSKYEAFRASAGSAAEDVLREFGRGRISAQDACDQLKALVNDARVPKRRTLAKWKAEHNLAR